MRIVIDRNLCDASLSFCQRCSAALIRYPEAHDRLCIRDIIDDDREMLVLELHNDDDVVVIELTEELRELGSVEGWEALVNFDPTLFRAGAMDRWREIRQLALNE